MRVGGACEDVIGFEVGVVGQDFNPTASPSGDQLRHLAWLRDRLDRAEPDAFEAGVLLHCGARAYKLGDRLHTAPIEHLWRPPPEVSAA